jgi:hypothetical protein
LIIDEPPFEQLTTKSDEQTHPLTGSTIGTGIELVNGFTLKAQASAGEGYATAGDLPSPASLVRCSPIGSCWFISFNMSAHVFPQSMILNSVGIYLSRQTVGIAMDCQPFDASEISTRR